MPVIEKGFIAYSSGNTIIPPVGELIFKDPPGDVHIKYGYIVNDNYYVIKIASSFYENPKINLPSSNGLMLLFCQKTGAILGILLDEGYLTDLRTATAGAIAAKYLAPRVVNKIGIIGTGNQARLQLSFLKQVTDCRTACVWGRNNNSLKKFQSDMEKEGFSIYTTQKIEDITSSCNLIITTTPSSSPLLWSDQVKNGTHITAVGADSPHKQELDPALFRKADIVVADSISQCIERGDIAHAIQGHFIKNEDLTELGNIIRGSSPSRKSDQQITIADLTGLAVQDIEITKAVYNGFKG